MKPLGIIGRRLLFWFTLIAIAPLAVVGIRSFRLARQAVEREAYLHMEAVAGYKQDQVYAWLKERQADLNLLASDPRILKAAGRQSEAGKDSAETINLLQSWLANSNGFDQVQIADSSGRVRLQSGHFAAIAEKGFSPANPRDWSSGDNGADFHFSPVGYEPGLGTWVKIARPLMDTGGHPNGWAIGRLALSHTLDPVLLDSTGLGHTGQIYLVDNTGLMLTRSRFLNHPNPGTHRMFTAGIDSALLGHSGAGIYKGYEGHIVLGSWRYLPGMNWALIGEMNQDEALAELLNLQRSWLIIAGLTLIVVIIVVAFITRSLSLPILRLTRAAERISQGDLSVRTGIERQDEVGVLAKTFDHMSEALVESRRSLEKSYQDLVGAERRLVQSEKLAAIGELVASVVHELRNPLSAVKMNLKILARKHPPEGAAAESLTIAQDQALRMERMLSQILDYSKPVKLNPAPTQVASLLNETLDPLKELISAGKIEVAIETQPGLPHLMIDRELMQQALGNLIRNAVEAMQGHLHARLQLSAYQRHSGELAITITDNGPGMSPAQLERIFEPFFTTRKEGTGLGLPNARKVIELHRGSLTITSREGQGTVAEIILPIRGEYV